MRIFAEVILLEIFVANCISIVASRHVLNELVRDFICHNVLRDVATKRLLYQLHDN